MTEKALLNLKYFSEKTPKNMYNIKILDPII